MTLPLELGGIRDPEIQRALQVISQQFPVVATGGGGGGAPSGPAGGVLAGTYPNPGFAADMATQAELDTHTVLTTGAHGGIVASTDPRLTDARTPAAHATTHQPGGSDAMAVDAAAATGSLRTLGTGAAQALPGNHASTTNARTPTAHATSHQPGGSDAMAVDAAAGTGSLRTLGTAATSAAAGNRGLPVGGATGQVLAKNTATDYDVGWSTPAGGGATVFYDDLQQGVVAAGDCALTVNTTAQVTIAAGTVYVTASGVLTRVAPGSTVLGSIPVASASNFRLDQVVVSSTGVVSRLQGTQSTTTTLANRTGAAAVPAGSLLLHDILVTATGVTLANTRDRRPWARGAYSRTLLTAANRTTASTTFVDVDTTNLSPRIECSGVPLKLKIRGGYAHSVAGIVLIALSMDGTIVDSIGSSPFQFYEPNAAQENHYEVTWDIVPTAGSHVFAPRMAVVTAGTLTLFATAGNPLLYTVEEIVRQDAKNG